MSEDAIKPLAVKASFHCNHAAFPSSLSEQVQKHWQAFANALERDAIEVNMNPVLRELTSKVWACSEFIAKSCVNNPKLLADLIQSGDLYVDLANEDFRRKLDDALEKVYDVTSLGLALRKWRRREMLRIAWRDIAGWASLDETLRDLSLLADVCVQAALQRLQQWLAQQRGVPCYPDGSPQSLVVLGLGKLGARELNFSSDIDLIFAYPEPGEMDASSGISFEEFFTRLGQQLIQCLGATTAEGFVFRVDMRLRPYGDSGPLVPCIDAIEDYYQSQGREWERYAMIKARVVAGDRQAGERLIEILQPFIYRRYLDYSAFESLREMKSLISRQVATKGMEDNIKLGPGGIREVEFIGQVFQLIRGGREPALQQRPIQKVLQSLADLEFLPRYVVHELLDAYRFLRYVENRLQQANDQQVHRLPGDDYNRLRLAFSMGFPNWTEFLVQLSQHRQLVHQHFEQIFESSSENKEDQASTSQTLFTNVWQGIWDGEPAVAGLQAQGFQDGQGVLLMLRSLREGLAYRSLSAVARNWLDRLMPTLMAEVAQSSQPDRCFSRIIAMLEAIAGRTTYYSMLVENPKVLAQLVKLFAASPWVAGYLTRHPVLWDELIDPRAQLHSMPREEIREQLSQAMEQMLATVDVTDLERQMSEFRYFKHSQVLRVAVADVMEQLPIMNVSDYLTEVAEQVVRQVLALAHEQMVVRYGKPVCTLPISDTGAVNRQPGFAIIAYGKLGGIELGYGSDLDLVFLHDAHAAGCITDGVKPIDCATFFARLGQRIIHMLNTLTQDGVLYEVDMRLRPSGASGLLVSSLDAFSDYQYNDAWTWEHQALVRARPIAGSTRIAKAFSNVRAQVLAQQRDPDKLKQEVGAMRAKMRAELCSRELDCFDIKQGKGGLADIEFLVQYWVLRWAFKYPQLSEFTDNIRIIEALVATKILSHSAAESLSDAYRAYRARIHQLTLEEQPIVVDKEAFADYRQQIVELWEYWIGCDQ